MDKKTATLALVTFLICLDLATAATKCYYCSTSVDPDNCGDPFVTANVQECVTSTNADFNCVKFKHVIGDRTIVYRSCRSARDTCRTVEDALVAEGSKFLSCELCSGNLCNSSAVFRITAAAPLALLVLVKLWG